MTKNIIEINKLTKTYGKHRGIEDITLAIQEGEIFGFIGPNGAGKSTTIRCLLSLIYPTSGSASIFGADCIKNASEIAKEVGYLPSEVFYYDNMKVKDLLNYSASFYKKDCKKKIRELCDVLELDTGRKIEDLSFGNRKKVGIVQGLLHSPKLIILDEPTSGLDPLMQKKFFDLIQEENRNGATVFFSSHILSEVQKMCDRVGFIKEGKLIKLDTMSSLKEDSYKKIELESKEALNPDVFQIKGLSNLKIEKLHASFIYRGNVNRMTHLLGELSLQDLSVQEPDLEEIFMHYYN
ncbi:ABC transporter ATP-binding protein [Robinsoniella peoriensis]|uniref:ABC transporter ATP-binding protein n=1 Tax=Robinsoniella peoriensis TaxID=180332 RepID=UPI0036313811